MLRKRSFGFCILVLVLILPVIVQNNSTSVALTNIDEHLKENDEGLTSYDLFQQDPTNPTQILKKQLREENEGRISLTRKEDSSGAILEDDTVGQQTSFWLVQSFLVFPYVYVQITATLQALGANCYIYVENGKTPIYTAEYWRDEFENKIYPNNIQYFGNTDGNLGDIDGDSHVTVLLTDIDGDIAGYFNPRNEEVITYSNEREMVYVDYDYSLGLGVLAHEFEHLIHYNYDPQEFTWVDEGCADYSKYLNGYIPSHNRSGFLSHFELNPEDSLLYWNYDSEGGKDVRIDYGGAYAFIFYVAEKYGDIAIKNIVSDTDTNAQGVEDSLNGLGYSLDFNELYLNWITALVVDDPSFGGGLYGFINLEINLDLDSTVSSFPLHKTNVDHTYYGIYGIKLNSPPDYFMYDVTGPPSYNLGFSIAYHDLNGWHVNQSIENGDFAWFINGTLIDTAYVISSIMEGVTPVIPFSEEFGLGYSNTIDYSIVIGQPLFISSATLNFDTDTWEFSLNNVLIEDINSTEITNTSDVSVFIQFQYHDTLEVYETLEMNYSLIDLWYIDLSLRSFDEDEYKVLVIASGSDMYGKQDIDNIVVEHILAVEKPLITLHSVTSLSVEVNASYTQLNSRETFTEFVQTNIILYDSSAVVVGAYEISYNHVSNKWESAVLNLDQFNGEYYISISFKYAGRTVRSPDSDSFTLEGDPPTTPNGTPSPFWMSISALLFLLVIPILRRKIR
ncbi:MAG: hypothetical protein KAS63_04165 [Candidatus Heimdallarchaeota archaeon]|nr:hypothetical protein [Candidatus Heimdallarchaeota archaeon]MCK4954530.1 hypothetical protein [Candidatus Heimdallarchaeota archaeon]